MGDMNFSLTTFNKTGKLMQIEYALARVNQGKMALGIKGTVLCLCVYSVKLCCNVRCLSFFQPRTE